MLVLTRVTGKPSMRFSNSHLPKLAAASLAVALCFVPANAATANELEPNDPVGAPTSAPATAEPTAAPAPAPETEQPAAPVETAPATEAPAPAPAAAAAPAEEEPAAPAPDAAPAASHASVAQPAAVSANDIPNGTKNSHGLMILNNGHVDYATVLNNGQLDVKIKDDTQSPPDTLRDLSSTIIHVNDNLKMSVPAGYGEILGAPEGSEIYVAQQTQRPDSIWPGWSTEKINAALTPSGVDWTLKGVRGPEGATFKLFLMDSMGQKISNLLFDSTDGMPDKTTIPANAHVHGNWVFNKPGLYCLDMQRSAKLNTGAQVSKDFVVPIAVGDVDLMALPTNPCSGSSSENPSNPTNPSNPSNPTNPGNTTSPNQPGNTTQPNQPGGTNGSNPAPGTKPGTQAPNPAASGTCADGQGAHVMSEGHADFGPVVLGGQLQAVIKDDVTGTWRNPAATVLWVKPEANRTIPLTQKNGIIWLGWNTLHMPDKYKSKPVNWTLNSVDGPGGVNVTIPAAFGGGEKVFTGAGQSFPIKQPTHTHGQWKFGADGIYHLNFTFTLTDANGGQVSTSAPLTIAVGQVDAASALGCIGGGGGLASVGAEEGTTGGGGQGGNSDKPAGAAATTEKKDDQATKAQGQGTPVDLNGDGVIDENERALAAQAAMYDPIRAAMAGNLTPLLIWGIGILLLIGLSGGAGLWWGRRSWGAGAAAAAASAAQPMPDPVAFAAEGNSNTP